MQVSVTPGSPVRLPVRIYGPLGAREVTALLDTGAYMLAIARHAADALGYELDQAPTARIATASGSADVPTIVLARLQVGEFSFDEIPTLCLDSLPVGASCLLGLNVLSRFNVFLDHKSGVLTIADP
ncbi:MAG: hypothetical protein FJ290_06445 [Planctomycetes bacterium]|nr:hypothetical protein [Planctomycetota bacterium]